MESEKYFYQKDWDDYRKKSKRALIGLPICFILFPLPILLLKFGNDNVIWLSLILMLSLVVIGNILAFGVTDWNCPRCGESFRNKVWVAGSLIATDCGKCGLKKYEGSTFQPF